MAEITGIATGVVKKIVMTGSAFHHRVIVMLERYLQQRSRNDLLITPTIQRISGADKQGDYKQGSVAHRGRSASGV